MHPRMERLDTIEEYPDIPPSSECELTEFLFLRNSNQARLLAHERFRRKLRLHLLTHNLVTDDIRFETFINRTLTTPSLSNWTFFQECHQFAERASPCTKCRNFGKFWQRDHVLVCVFCQHVRFVQFSTIGLELDFSFILHKPNRMFPMEFEPPREP